MSTPISELPFTPPLSNPAQVKFALPERDVPKETMPHTTDPQSVPSYMPPKAPEYIAPAPQAPPTKPPHDYAALMEEMRVPLLVALLFLVFNMAAMQNFLHRLIPSIKESSNSELIKSALFGVFYFGTNRALEHFAHV